MRSAVSEVLDGTVHLKTGPASVTSSSAQSPDSSPPLESTGGAPSFSPAQLTPLRVASNKSWHGGTAAWDALNGRSASTSPGGFRRLSLSRRKPSRSLSVPDQLDQLVAAHNSSPISPRLLFRSRAAASVLAPAAASAVADVTAAPVSPPPPRRPRDEMPRLGQRRPSIPYISAIPSIDLRDANAPNASSTSFVNWPVDDGGGPPADGYLRLPPTSYPPPSSDEHAGGEEPTLARAGWLTKLSKGGFMANWNRRFFALVGSTLYYGASPAELCIEPKLFVRLDDVANLSYATTCDARAPR